MLDGSDEIRVFYPCITIKASLVSRFTLHLPFIYDDNSVAVPHKIDELVDNLTEFRTNIIEGNDVFITLPREEVALSLESGSFLVCHPHGS